MPTRPLARPFGTNVLALLALAFLAVLGTSGMSIWASWQAGVTAVWVSHTQSVRTVALQAASSGSEAEAAKRGYLLTREARFLTGYQRSRDRVFRSTAELRQLTLDNPSQTSRIDDLTRTLHRRFAYSDRVLELARAGSTSAAVDLVRGGVGTALMEQGRRELEDVVAEEDRLLVVRNHKYMNVRRANVVISVLGAALILGVAFACLELFRRNIATVRSSRDEVARLNAGLEETVAKRTEELVRANEEIQRFAYIVSHDLRAPLVNVMGYTSEMTHAAEVLARQVQRIGDERPELLDPEAVTAVEEDVPEAIGFIRASTSKMDRLINAILKLSREGRRSMAAESVEMTTAVQAMAAALKHQTDAAGARIEVEDLPPLTGDRVALEQVFGNLLDNAVKYLDKSRPGLIRVTGRQDGSLNRYEIADNGRGIDPKDHERVFELFRRAGVQDTQGEGLGLAFVRNTVRRMGGVIDVRSTPGQGATFTVALPRAVRNLGVQDG